MIHHMTPGKATVTQKLRFCMTKLCMLARAHVLHNTLGSRTFGKELPRLLISE